MAEPKVVLNRVNPSASITDFVTPPPGKSTTVVIEIDSEGQVSLVLSQTDSEHIKPVIQGAISSEETALILNFDSVPFRIQKLIGVAVQPLLTVTEEEE